MKIKNIHNAFTVIEDDNNKIIFDPWISDGIFDGGWGIFPPVNNIEKHLENVTHCFISHIHEDHFDLEAIKLLDTHTQFLIPDIYPNHVIKETLNNLNFSNVHKLKPLESYEIDYGLQLKVIPPLNAGGLETLDDNYDGDLGFLSVDAGVMIENDDAKVVLLSDNGPYDVSDEILKEIKNCDLIAFPFNGVADDYPVCFDNLTVEEKRIKSLVRQQKRTSLQTKSLAKIKPKYLMPYSSDMVIMGKRAMDFIDTHPIEYIERDRVCKIYYDITKITCLSVNESDEIKIKSNNLTFIKGNNEKIDWKKYGFLKYNQDKNDKIIYTPYEHLADLFYSFVEATQRMFKMMDKLNIKSDWWLSIYLTDVNVWFYVNLKTRGTVLSYQRMNYKKEQVLKIHSEYFNSHLLFKHHWNNSIISYNLDWERTDDVFDYGLNKALNFLHV